MEGKMKSRVAIAAWCVMMVLLLSTHQQEVVQASLILLVLFYVATKLSKPVSDDNKVYSLVLTMNLAHGPISSTGIFPSCMDPALVRSQCKI
jgi:hypothetical protein